MVARLAETGARVGLCAACLVSACDLKQGGLFDPTQGDSGGRDGGGLDGDVEADAETDAGCGCGWGCTEVGCFEPDVPNLDDDDEDWLTEGGADLVFDRDGSIETSGPDQGRIESGDSELRGPGTGVDDGIRFEVRDQGTALPQLAVLVVRSLRIGNDVDVLVRGDRALMIIASESIDIEGTLDVSSTMRVVPGPGGYGPSLGPGAGADGEIGPTDDDGGGAGGGHGGTGGAGGGSLDAVMSAGGMAYGDGTLEPLQGGSGGGQGISPDPDNTGGSGGGAVELVAGTAITVASDGEVHAGGAGGGAHDMEQGGGGGGAGGAILLMAPVLAVDGTLAANGGGGGGIGDRGRRGEDGRRSDTPASGGDGPKGVQWGGDGAAASSIDGEEGRTDDLGGGGGGGAAGRIRLIDLDGVLGGTGVVSPALDTPAVRVEAAR